MNCAKDLAGGYRRQKSEAARYERRGGIGSTKLTARVCPLFSRIAAALR